MRLKSGPNTSTFIPANNKERCGPLNEDDEPDPEPVIDRIDHGIDQGELQEIIRREQEMVASWAEKLKTLTKTEHTLYHWYVTSGVPKNRVCKELHLETWQFYALAHSAGKKLGIPLRQIRDERRLAAAAAAA